MQADLNDHLAIVMPLGRLSEWFQEALDSALNQTICTKIYLIANGLSAAEINLLQRISNDNSRILLHSFSERVNMVDNWNRALNAVSEDMITMLHDDDFLEPWAVETLLSMEKKMPGRGIYLSKERLIDAAGAFHHDEIPQRSGNPKALENADIENWALANKICATGFMMDRRKAQQEGGYNTDFPYTTDWDLYFTIALKYGSVEISDHCARYRFGGQTGQLSSGFIRTGSFVREIRRQQHTNILKIGSDPISLEKRSVAVVNSFATFAMKNYPGSIDHDGIEIIKEVRFRHVEAKIVDCVRKMLRRSPFRYLIRIWLNRNCKFNG